MTQVISHFQRRGFFNSESANLLITMPLRSTHVYRILTLLVCGEALFGKFFVLGARTAVVGVWEDGDAAARGE